MTVDVIIYELEAANPVRPPDPLRADTAWNSLKEKLTAPERRRVSRGARLAGATGILVAALVAVVLFQASPTPLKAPTAASAAPFLRRAAHAVLTAPTFNEQSGVVPQANQYVYSETEDPSGTLYQLWLSTNGNLPALHRYVSSSGDVIAPGMVSNAACTLAQAESESEQTRCVPEAGYLPDLPTDPTALLSYLNQIGVVDTNPYPGDTLDTPGWLDNALSMGITNLLQTCYLLPAQQSALYTLMAQTPGFTIVPNMADAIGRVGVGVEWSFQGDSGALIFNPSTYALLGLRTWPGPPDPNAPYDGDALLGISVVDSVPATQSPPAT